MKYPEGSQRSKIKMYEKLVIVSKQLILKQFYNVSEAYLGITAKA